MTRFLHIAALSLLISCTRSNILPPFIYPSSSSTLYSQLPFLSLSYGDQVSTQFNSYNIYISNNRMNDTSDHSYTITAVDAINTLIINIKADSLTPGSFDMNGLNGDVSIFQNGGKSQIGSLAPGLFNFTIYSRTKNEIDGAFTGQLKNPFKSNLQYVSGSFANLVAN